MSKTKNFSSPNNLSIQPESGCLQILRNIPATVICCPPFSSFCSSSSTTGTEIVGTEELVIGAVSGVEGEGVWLVGRSQIKYPAIARINRIAITRKVLFFGFNIMIKNFLSPKIQNMVRADVFNRVFGSFYRCGSAAFPHFRGGNSSPPQVAKCVRTNSRILLQKGKIKRFWFASLRSATNSYSILGVKTNSRFRKIWFEPMFFRNVVIAVGLGEESRLAA